MGFGLQPRDRRQAHREHRSGSQVSNMVASRAPCLNRVQGAAHRVVLAHFDNREHPAGMDLCVYCDVGYEFRFSPPNWGVVDPRRGVAKWLAAKALPRHGNLLRVLQPVRVQIRRNVKRRPLLSTQQDSPAKPFSARFTQHTRQVFDGRLPRPKGRTRCSVSFMRTLRARSTRPLGMARFFTTRSAARTQRTVIIRSLTIPAAAITLP